MPDTRVMAETSGDSETEVLRSSDYKHPHEPRVDVDGVAGKGGSSRLGSQSSSRSSLKSSHTSSSSSSSSSRSLPPDGGWGWMIVFASFCCNVIVDGIILSFGIILLEVQKQFGSSKGTTAWIGSLQTGFYLMIGPVVSALANRYGCRSVTMMGSLIASTGFLLSFWATSVLWLDITFGVIGGIGFGFIYLPAIVTVGYYFESKRAFATGIAVCGSGIGAFIMAPLIQYLIQCFGWRGCVLILSGLILNCILFGSLFRPLDQRSVASHKPLLSKHRESEDGDHSLDEDEGDEEEDSEDENGNRVTDLERVKCNFVKTGVAGRGWMKDGVTNFDRLSMPDMMSLLRNAGTKRTSADDPLDGERDRQAFRPRAMTGFSARNYLHGLMSHQDNNGSLVVSSQPAVGGRIRDFAGDHNLRLNSSLIVTRSQVFALNLQMDDGKKAWRAFPAPIPDPLIKRTTSGVASGRGEENRITTVRGVNDQDRHQDRHPGSGHKGTEDERQEEGRKELPVRRKAQNDPLNESSEEERGGKRESGTKRVDQRTGHQSQESDAERITSTKSMKIEMSEDSSSIGTALGVDPRDEGSMDPRLEGTMQEEGGRSGCFYSSGDARLTSEEEEDNRKERMEAGVGTSVTRVTRHREKRKKKRTSKSVVRSSSSLMSDLMESLDPELLSSPSFLLLSVSGFLTLAGFFIPFTYIVDRAMLQGVSVEKSAYLLSVIGITNTVGRVFCGWISDHPRVNALAINNTALVVGGGITLLSPLVCNSFLSLVLYCAVFGFSIACFAALRSVITVELLGLEKLTKAFGLLLLPQGIATIIGTPFAGLLYDMTGSYDSSFFVAGSLITLSGLMCVPLKRLSEWETMRKHGRLSV